MPQNVFLIMGDEYLAASKAKEIVAGLVPPGDEALGLETVDGVADTVDAAVTVVTTCRAALETMGFLGGGKVVWLNRVTFLYENAVGKSARVKEALGQLADLIKEGLPGGNTLVVSSPRVDKRSAFYKACKACGELHVFEVADKAYMAERQAKQFAQKAFSDVGLRADDRVVDAFVARVGTDTRAIVNEAGKLAVYLGAEVDVRLEDVRTIVSLSRDAIVWDLVDAVAGRDLPGSLALVRQLLFAKESAVGLVINLHTRFRELSLYREALDREWIQPGGRNNYTWANVPPEAETMLSEHLKKDPRKTHPYRVGILARQAKQFSPVALRRCQQAIAKAHADLVSSRMPDQVVLEMLMFRLLGRRRVARAVPVAAR